MSPKERLVAWLKGLGVAYEEVPSAEFKKEWRWLPDFFDAPFTSGLGIHWPYQRIIGVPGTGWPAILHEAGHLVATDGNLKTTNELVFLGWEWAVMQHLDLPQDEWLKSNSDYGIDGASADAGSECCDTIGHLAHNPQALQRVMAEMVSDAKRYGTITDDGTPVAHPNRRFEALR